MLDEMLDFLYPPSCLVCDSTVPAGSKCICLDCRPGREDLFISSAFESISACEICSGHLSRREDGTSYCNICCHAPLPFSKVFSLWAYTNRAEKFLSSMKYRSNGHNIIPLAVEYAFNYLAAESIRALYSQSEGGI